MENLRPNFEMGDLNEKPFKLNFALTFNSDLKI